MTKHEKITAIEKLVTIIKDISYLRIHSLSLGDGIIDALENVEREAKAKLKDIALARTN